MYDGEKDPPPLAAVITEETAVPAAPEVTAALPPSSPRLPAPPVPAEPAESGPISPLETLNRIGKSLSFPPLDGAANHGAKFKCAILKTGNVASFDYSIADKS